MSMNRDHLDWEQLEPVPGELLALINPPRRESQVEVSENHGHVVELSRYVAAALERECERVRRSQPGNRNNTLNSAAFSLGQLVDGEALTREDVESALLTAGAEAGLSEDETMATIRSGLDAGATEPRSVPEGNPVTGDVEVPYRRPTILIQRQLAEMCDRAEGALMDDPHGNIYQRSGLLVSVGRESRKAQGVWSAVQDRPRITTMSIPHLRLRMDLAAQWLRPTERAPVPDLPPRWVCETLIERGDWRFPRLEGVIETPTIRPDGSVLDRPGYDADSGLLYLPSIRYPRIPAEPTKDDAADAAVALLEPFRDFPFTEEPDQAACLAAVLSVVGRGGIEGPVPMFAVRAPTPGTGKTLLAMVISILGTGRRPSLTTIAHQEDEMRKRILSLAMAGTPVVLIDNVVGALGSGTLSAALTTTEFSDRLLGVNKFVTAPLTAVWFASGNGLTFRGDLGRRIVPIDLDAEEEHPEDREGFAHPSLATYIRQERARLVSAALTILRAYQVAGRPSHGQSEMGSYEAWDRLVRGACIWLGVGDPVGGRERIRDEGDDDLDQLRGLYTAWYQVLGDKPTTVNAVIRAATDAGNESLRDALAALDNRSTPGGGIDVRRVGNRLRVFKDRIAGGYRLEKADRRIHNRVLWSVVRVGHPRAGGQRELESPQEDRDDA